ncbi:DUF2752 domain-containing protein [Mycolicibacterium sp. 3033]|nr:DUF2752 domain-containing protein [Mycolicibacterium aurantiacum]
MAPDAPTRTWTRPLAVVGGGVALVGSLAYVGLGNPHSADFVFLPCPFKALTGWNCPACGGLRMTHDLLHGDLAAAFVDNAFVLIGLPLLLAWMMLRRYRGQSAANTPVFVVVIVTAVAWTIVRNLPGFPLVPTVLTG